MTGKFILCKPSQRRLSWGRQSVSQVNDVWAEGDSLNRGEKERENFDDHALSPFARRMKEADPACNKSRLASLRPGSRREVARARSGMNQPASYTWAQRPHTPAATSCACVYTNWDARAVSIARIECLRVFVCRCAAWEVSTRFSVVTLLLFFLCCCWLVWFTFVLVVVAGRFFCAWRSCFVWCYGVCFSCVRFSTTQFSV